jgi:aryl-alcohol dehydrogenase-like predicted oxidoreductase
MEYRSIPTTDLSVSLLGFGNFTFGTDWWGDFTDEQAVTLQNQAFDRGVNFFDSAPAYGNGRAETLLARTIEYAGRDNVVVSTKFGYDFYSDPGEQGSHRERKQDFSPDFVRFELEQSLTRLKTDRIDLYQAHNIKLPQYADELFAALEKLKEQGKIRYWGIALGPAIGWREEGYEALIRRGADTVQTVFNMYEQDPGREFCEIAERVGRGGIIARVPTNSGILDEEFSSPEHVFAQRDHRKFRDRDWLVYGLKKNEMIRPLAEQAGLSIRQFAFRFLASYRSLVSIEPNILTLADVEQFAAACDARPLDQDTLKKIAAWYDEDFGLGSAAHPCDWKSSMSKTGSVRSSYEKPNVGSYRTPQVV